MRVLVQHRVGRLCATAIWAWAGRTPSEAVQTSGRERSCGGVVLGEQAAMTRRTCRVGVEPIVVYAFAVPTG